MFLSASAMPNLRWTVLATRALFLRLLSDDLWVSGAKAMELSAAVCADLPKSDTSYG
jgi:hypothetical protein